MGLFDKKIKYYDVTELCEKYPSMYYILLSGRDAGKSTSVAKRCVQMAYNNELLFAYVRRAEGKVADVKRFFDNKVLRMFYSELTGGEYTDVEVKSDEVYFIKYDEKGKKVKGPVLGYVFYLNKVKSGIYKSQQYDQVYKIIFEEFIIENDDIYLPDEVQLFENLLSTVLRKRIFEPTVEIFLIGNKVNKICPYMAEYGANDALNLPPDTIRQYTFTRFNDLLGEEDKIVLTVHMIPNLQKGGGAISKKGKQAESNEWVTGEHPKLEKGEDWKKYDLQYEFIFTYLGFYFRCRCLTKDGANIFLFVTPIHFTELIKEDDRVIGDVITKSIYYTYDFTPLVQRENIIFNLIRQRKVYFSDHQTGTNFWNAYKALRKS